MPTDTLRCYRCDDWHDPDLGRPHAHGLAAHGSARDDLAQANRRNHRIPGRLVSEWTLPDGRRWLRAERARQDAHERGKEVAAAVLAYFDLMAPEHAFSRDGRWRLRPLISRHVRNVLQRGPAREAAPLGTEDSHGLCYPEYRR